MYTRVQQYPEYIVPHTSCWTRNKRQIVTITTVTLLTFYCIMEIYGIVTNNPWLIAGGIIGLIVTLVSYCLWERSRRRQDVSDEFMGQLSAAMTDIEEN